MTKVTKLLNLTKRRAGELRRAMNLMGTTSFTEAIDTLLAFYLAMMVLPHHCESVSIPRPGVNDAENTDTTHIGAGGNERELRAKIDELLEQTDAVVAHYGDSKPVYSYGSAIRKQSEAIDAIVNFAASKGFKR